MEGVVTELSDSFSGDHASLYRLVRFKNNVTDIQFVTSMIEFKRR